MTLKAVRVDDWSEHMKKRISGSALQTAVEQALYYDNYLVFRINMGAAWFEGKDGKPDRFVRFGWWSLLGHEWQRKNGVSDLLAFRDGLLLGCEIKGDGDRERPGQKAFRAAVEAAGGIGLVVKAVEDLRPYLSRVEVQ
jgi:hypothetical protein